MPDTGVHRDCVDLRVTPKQIKHTDMYTEYFGFSRRPFELIPEPSFLFLTPQHARAIANIEFALMNRDSFVVISGEVGIGKTTILNQITSELPENFVVARLTHTTLSPIELIQAILSAYGVPSYKNNKVYLLDCLREFLLSLDHEDGHAIIMVDEAQNLRLDTLEELRLLSCLNGDERKLVSIILVGQPALNQLIDDDRLANLRDRTRLRQHLAALDRNDTRDYILHRLEVAGGDFEKTFTHDVPDMVYDATGGIPRRINTLCDTALAIAFVEKKKRIDAEIIKLTLEEINLGQTKSTTTGGSSTNIIRPHSFQENGNATELSASELRNLSEQSVDSGAPWIAVYFEERCCDVITIDQLPFLFGRDSSNSYSMNSASVSRRHAVIVRSGNDIIIEDLASTNGTHVNDARGRRHLLRPGDVVSIGVFKLVYCPEDLPLESSQPNLG